MSVGPGNRACDEPKWMLRLEKDKYDKPETQAAQVPFGLLKPLVHRSLSLLHLKYEPLTSETRKEIRAESAELSTHDGMEYSF